MIVTESLMRPNLTNHRPGRGGGYIFSGTKNTHENTISLRFSVFPVEHYHVAMISDSTFIYLLQANEREEVKYKK